MSTQHQLPSRVEAEIIEALRAAGCGIIRRPIPVEPAEKQPNQHTMPRAPLGRDLKTILRLVGDVCKISATELASERRHKPTCRARHIFYYVAREISPASLPTIGRACGNRDHSTVLHGIDKVTHDMGSFEPELSQVMRLLKRRG